MVESDGLARVTDLTRAGAEKLDAADPLAQFRDRFVIDDPSLIYMDGNSLGRLPIATERRLAQLIREEWGGGLVRTWDEWLHVARTRRRSTGRRAPRRRAGSGRRERLDHGEPLQVRCGCDRRSPRAAGHRHRLGELPDRPVRRRRTRARARPHATDGAVRSRRTAHCADGVRRHRRGRRSRHVLARELRVECDRGHARDHGSRASRRRARAVGPVAHGAGRIRSSSTPRMSISRSGAPTSTSMPGRERRRSST